MPFPDVQLHGFEDQVEDLDVLIFGLFQDEDIPAFLEEDHAELALQLKTAFEDGKYSAKLNETRSFTVPGDGAAKHFLAVGLGKREKFDADACRQAAASAGQVLVKEKVARAGCEFLGQDALKTSDISALAEGLLLGSYQFLAYKAEDPEDPRTSLESIHVFASDVQDTDLQYGVEIARGVYLTRDLGNHPSNVVTPSYLADTALSLADADNFKVTVLNREDFSAQGFGGLAGVAQGSNVPPKFIIMEYTGGETQGGEKRGVFLWGGGGFFSVGVVRSPPARDGR